MKFSIRTSLFLVTLLFISAPVFGQILVPARKKSVEVRTPKKTIHLVGLAQIYHDEDEDKTGAEITISRSDEIKKPKKITNNLYVLLSYDVNGKKTVEPEFLDLKIDSFSSGGEKYKDNNKLGIYADDALLFTEEPVNRSLVHPVEMWIESFKFPKLKLQDFRKMIEAKVVRIEFGETKFQLTADDKERLLDLNKTMTYMD